MGTLESTISNLHLEEFQSFFAQGIVYIHTVKDLGHHKTMTKTVDGQILEEIAVVVFFIHILIPIVKMRVRMKELFLNGAKLCEENKVTVQDLNREDRTVDDCEGRLGIFLVY